MRLSPCHRFRARLAEALRGLNPADLRGRFWKLYCEVLSEGLAERDIPLQALPEAVFESHHGQRFLAPEMRAKDPTHGNAAYGAAVLTAILDQSNFTAAVAA